MEAKELRIGNWIKAPLSMSSEIIIPAMNIQILAFKYDYLVLNSNPSEHINWEVPDRHCIGIELTEEWLVKFGFKKFKNYNDWSIGGFIIHGRKRGFVFRKSVPVVKYVHQLQNLHFALTGKELEIN